MNFHFIENSFAINYIEFSRASPNQAGKLVKFNSDVGTLHIDILEYKSILIDITTTG